MKLTVSHFFKHKRLLPVCLALLLISSQNSFAQNDTSKTLKQVDVNRNLTIQPVTPLQQVSNKEFLQMSSFSVADAVRNFSGVNIKDYGGIGGLKTISVRSLGGNHTAVLFDGVQLNDAQNGQIDLSKFNLNNIESIALYNGQPDDLPQPARSFGAASVISIKTIKPTLSISKPYQIQAGVKAGSFGLINPYLQWQQRVNCNWAFVLNTNYINANGKYKYKVDGDGSDTLAVRTNGNVRSVQTDAALYWTKTDSNKFNIHLNYYNAKRGLPGAVIFYNPYTNEHLENDDIFIQAAYQRTWRSSLQLLVNSKVSQLKTRYFDPNYLNQQGFVDQNYNQREFYQSVALAYAIIPDLTISYATDVSFVKMDADIYNYAYPSRFTLLNVLAASFTAGKLKIQGNLLQTSIKETVRKGTAPDSRFVLSPTIMASIKPFDNNLQVRAFYKSIFRPPTLDELYFYAVAPRNTRPEFVKQYDLGITWAENYNGVLKYISLTADAYYNDITDKILASPNKNPAIFSFGNIGRVEVTGVDVGVKAQTQTINKWYGTLSANYTYQRAIDVTDKSSPLYLEQIPYTPNHTLALNAGVNYKSWGLYFNQILSSSRYYSANNAPEYYVPGYYITDASTSYSFVLNKLPVTTSFEVNNMFNSNYSIIRSYPMPGRSYRLSFQITI